jgi:hypothetical protein
VEEAIPGGCVMHEAADLMQWVERLGGWAVVLLVVRWMMMRMDRMIDGWETVVTGFNAFQSTERDHHSEMLRTQRDILAAIRELKS